MPESNTLIGRLANREGLVALAAFKVGALAMTVGTASAMQSDICSSGLVEDVIEPLLQAAFYVGPILGALAGVISLVMMSQVTSKEKKKTWKERRNDAFLYGVVGVLAAGYIIEFLATTIFDFPADCLNTSFMTTAQFAEYAVTVLAYVPV